MGRQLIDALYSQKVLLAAENNELSLNIHPVDGCGVVKEVVELFCNRFQSHKIGIELPVDEKVTFHTDRSLLTRILGNMIQNAVEASRPDEPVRVSCKAHRGDVEFQVHNKGYIARQVQLQLFQRSFSTKGAGRGLGTYSMKLLGERYLKGRISFESLPSRGTTFSACFLEQPSYPETSSEKTGTNSIQSSSTSFSTFTIGPAMFMIPMVRQGHGAGDHQVGTLCQDDDAGRQCLKDRQSGPFGNDLVQVSEMPKPLYEIHSRILSSQRSNAPLSSRVTAHRTAPAVLK